MRHAICLICIVGCLSIEITNGQTITPKQHDTDIFSSKSVIKISKYEPIPGITGTYARELNSVQRLYFDRFGYPANIDWILRSDDGSYSIHENFASSGKNLFSDSLIYSARETAVKTAPLAEWEHSTEQWGRDNENAASWIMRFFAWTVRTAIGNTAEEDLNIVSATPSYQSLKHLRKFNWQSENGIWRTLYGWRPWRDNPYVYLNNAIGHNKDRPLIYTSLRCYGYLRPSDFGLLKLETQAIITLTKQSQLVFGAALYPFNIDSPEHPTSASLRLEKVICGGVGSIGATTSHIGQFYSISWGTKF